MIKETLAMPGTATTGVGDTFEFSFEKGEFVSLNLMRISRDGVVGKSIRVVAKDGVAFMVIPSPWKRMDLTSAVIAEGRVSLASHDYVFNYDLLLPDGISRFFPRVFSFIPGAVGSI
ncbi:hypothetical protein [Clavibacter tessellarius]|uniref:hypothetical protein n=1 Tax=Clavibacter tessellarius TaxID=31965 RepID=UPI003249FE92